MNLSRIGLDLAKQVFQVHGVDRHEQVVCRRQLKRAQVRDFFRQLPPCLVAMEACGSAHYWARELRELGHTVRLIAPQFVKPYVKGDKHDAHDAEAICEAASRPSMRYVPVKSAEQQAVQSVHRVRSRLVRARTALCNEVRGLLGEFGLIATRRGRAATMALLETVMATEPASLPAPMGELLRELKDECRRWRWKASARSAPAPWRHPPVMHGNSARAASLRPGWAWCHGNTPRAGSSAWATSASAAIPTCGPCSSMAPAQSCAVAPTRPMPAAAGCKVCCNGVLPMSSPLPWPTRMPGSFGPYSAGRHATGPVERSCHTVVETSATIAQ